jgi:hypothetical protein
MASQSQITFPDDYAYAGLEKFKGINTKAKRPAIDDEESAWLENLMPIGDANMRAMPDRGPTLYTAPGGLTIVQADSFNIGNTDFEFVCLSDGSAVAVRQANGAVTTIAGAGTFYNGGDLPHITQFGASGILIVTTATANGYYAWDGTLYSPGGSAPTWLDGLAANIVIAGASHGTKTLDGFSSTVGVVVGMVVTGSAGDIPVNTFVTGGTATTVTISNAATGSNSENFTFSWQMPTGIQGTGIDTYQNRVFIANGPTWLMSASGNGAYFAAANGGSITTSTDSSLRKKYVAVQSANGYVYLLSDSSIWNISNVTQTITNNVATAIAQYANSDAQTGTSWPNSVTQFSRAIILINPNGVFDLLGNSATKISDSLDGLFANLDQSVIPTAAVCTLFGIRCLVVCFKSKDYLGNSRAMLACFDGKKWWMASQTVVPTFIWTSEINSTLTTYGTDGNIIFPLFQTPSNVLLKTLQSKLYGGKYGYLTIKNALRYYLQLDTLGNTVIGPTVTVDSDTSSVPVQGSLSGQLVFTNSSGQVIQFQNALLQTLFWSLNGLVNVVSGPNAGNLLGFTFTNMSSDFVIERTGIGFQDQSANY